MFIIEDTSDKSNDIVNPDLPLDQDALPTGGGTETDLVLQARRGDKPAFARLVEIYWTPIYCYLFRLVTQAELSADLTQETFFKAFQGIGEIPSSRELVFRPWLYRIATNLALSELRRTQKQRWFSLDRFNDRPGRSEKEPTGSVNQPQLQLADKKLGPAEISLATEQSQELAAIFEKLPHEQTILLLLRFYHELNYEEISQVLGGLRQDAVRARLYRARLAFCRLYAEVEQRNQSSEVHQ